MTRITLLTRCAWTNLLEAELGSDSINCSYAKLHRDRREWLCCRATNDPATVRATKVSNDLDLLLSGKSATQMRISTTGNSLAPVGVTVVVVAHNEESRISDCIGSLAQQIAKGVKVELILIDDGSTDRTVELAYAAAPGLTVISNPSQSISSNRNCGLRAASHPYVAFIDADCAAPTHWLATLARGMCELSSLDGEPVAAVGGANVPPAGETPFYDALALMLNTRLGSRGSVQGMVFDQARQVAHLPGLNVLYNKEALEKVGGWDERFALIGEDEDLSRRLALAGFSLFFVPEAVVVHRQRSNFRAWAKNMFTYGKGRMWLIRHHPTAFESGLLIPPLLPLLLWAYLPVIAVISLGLAWRSNRLDLWPRLALLYATTHVSYGLGQWAGLFSVQDGVQRNSA